MEILLVRPRFKRGAEKTAVMRYITMKIKAGKHGETNEREM